MDTALAAMPIIDVDTHYTEHLELWKSLAPASLNARVPRGASIGNLWAGMDNPTAIATLSSLANITNMRLTPLEYFQRQIYASYWFETDVA